MHDIETVIEFVRESLTPMLLSAWSEKLSEYEPVKRAEILRRGLLGKGGSVERLCENDVEFAILMPAVVKRIVDDFIAARVNCNGS